MAKVKSKPDKRLYKRLRANGVRKKVAQRVSEALPSQGSSKSGAARRAAADLGLAVDEIRDRVKGGPQKRSAASKKAARRASRRPSSEAWPARRAPRSAAARGPRSIGAVAPAAGSESLTISPPWRCG